MRRANLLAFGLLVGWGCEGNPILGVGQVGRPIRLASGENAPRLPQLAFTEGACGEQSGGCDTDECALALVDSLAVFTAVSAPDPGLDFVPEHCIEVRNSAGLGAPNPSDEALAGAVPRFRFERVPTVFAPVDGRDSWSWSAGNEVDRVDPAAVLGGNLLSRFAVQFRTPSGGGPTISFFRDFPGTERNLASQGRAFIPVQFPGRLVGAEVADRCQIGDESCRIAGFDIVQGQSKFAIRSSRLVLDACIAPPACSIRYTVDPAQPFEPGTCTRTPGPDVETECVSASASVGGGRPATLVVATGVPGIVLFEDSARRMFGDLEQLPGCEGDYDENTLACLEQNEATLHFTGWPSAGTDGNGLYALRIRSFALVPGGTTVRTVGPCERTRQRLDALFGQCVRFTREFDDAGTIEDTTPPYAASDGDSDTSLAMLGEVSWRRGELGPSSDRWLSVRILPETHPLVLALRLDVTPESLQPDGLLGTALLDDTVTILDYTDPNPSVRVSCLDPRQGDCLVAPDCGRDGDAACCFGLPLDQLVDFILLGGDETCCVALSAAELEEIQERGVCLDQLPL